jgi:hypothetical protein
VERSRPEAEKGGDSDFRKVADGPRSAGGQRMGMIRDRAGAFAALVGK